MGSKLLQVYTGIQLNKYTLSKCTDFYMEMSTGVSLLRIAQSLLTGRTIVSRERMTKALNRLHKCAGWSMSVIRMKQNSGSLAVADPEGVRSNPLPVPRF